MSTGRAAVAVAFAVALACLLAVPSTLAEEPESSCLGCHGDEAMLGDTTIVDGWRTGVHAAAGIGCVDCHGGNPDPALADDMDAAMDPGFGPSPYVGPPARTDIPGFCGRCHSDPTFMRKFQADPRVDQEKQYWQSQHGIALSGGDPDVATCISCHGVHGILSPSDTSSPVYPLNVASTCAHCHADADKMARHTLPDGRPFPVDQKALWEVSVHAKAMHEKGDLSAPTCNDCHGDHGAMPPGLESISYVCGQCHGREAELFRASPKEAGFSEHDSYLADAGSDRCAACHSSSEPAAAMSDTVTVFSECITCHHNHAVVRPTIAMLGPLPNTPCELCHESTTDIIPEREKTMEHYEEVKTALLSSTDLEGEARFNWLVEQAQNLEPHTTRGKESGERTMKPEFKRLFEKLRIGTTTFTYPDPAGSGTLTGHVLRCVSCHSPEPELTDEPVGFTTSKTFMDHAHELAVSTARAERMILAAQRRGVHVTEALDEVDAAVESQIKLQVLTHSFDISDGSTVAETFAEGQKHAQKALEEASDALDEASFRRRGLTASLIIIALLLVALALKIRQIS